MAPSGSKSPHNHKYKYKGGTEISQASLLTNRGCLVKLCSIETQSRICECRPRHIQNTCLPEHVSSGHFLFLIAPTVSKSRRLSVHKKYPRRLPANTASLWYTRIYGSPVHKSTHKGGLRSTPLCRLSWTPEKKKEKEVKKLRCVD